MSNRICEVHLRDHSIDVAGSEVWITVVPEQLRPAVEVRGRLMGPQCLYSTTIEVAYPLRPFPRPVEGLPGLPMRVIIPESSLWEPQCPFLYRGPVELWEDGHLCDLVQVQHGLRVIRVGPRGLRLNGRPFAIQGIRHTPASKEEAGQLHRAGINTLLVPVEAATARVWDLADEIGFLILGRLEGDPASFQLAHALAAHPCCSGWVLPSEWLQQPDIPSGLSQLLANRRGHLVGVELNQLPLHPVPPEFHFVIAEENLLSARTNINLPRLIITDGEPHDGELTTEGEALNNILGWIRATTPFGD